MLEMTPCDVSALRAHLKEHVWADFTFRLPGVDGSEVSGRGNVYRQTGQPALALRFFRAKHVDLGFKGLIK